MGRGACQEMVCVVAARVTLSHHVYQRAGISRVPGIALGAFNVSSLVTFTAPLLAANSSVSPTKKQKLPATGEVICHKSHS